MAEPQRKGLIGIFTAHPTAANLLMAAMVIAGLFALSRINTQFFPDFGIDMVTVSVEWPGASAEDMDANVVQAIEPAVRFLDGVKRVTSSSFEGRSSLAVEMLSGTDMQKALADVETAVDQVTTLPADAERPVVRRLTRYDTISRLVISGPYPEAALKAWAKRIRDELLDLGVDKVDMTGARDVEILVEIEDAGRRRLGLSLSDIGGRIAADIGDLPAGGTSGGAERQIRSFGAAKDAEGIGGVEVRALGGGEKIRLRDVARISETFDRRQTEVYSNGHRAIELHVQRSVNADALKIADTVEDYLSTLTGRIPPNLTVNQYDVMSDLIRGRMDLLLRNGYLGLTLVLLVLFLFLNFRVGFWVAAAIPVSLLATMVLMLASGQTINMVSMFALIMMIGIIVDDSIVVGEHAEARHRAGLPPLEAARSGAARMATPVLASSLTTVAAFAPLLMISDIIGTIIAAIPYVAIVVILASLIECFLVLPNHMAQALKSRPGKPFVLRRRFNAAFDAFRDGPFTRAVTLALRWRYLTVAGAVALFIVCLGLVAGGRIGFHFFHPPEADKVLANVQMVPGTPRADTRAAVAELERAARGAEAKLTQNDGGMIATTLALVGRPAAMGLFALADGDHLGGLVVELTPSDQRTIRTEDFIAAWRAEIREPAGSDGIVVQSAQAGPPGLDVDIRIRGEDVTRLKQAATEVRRLLASYPGVSSIEDDLPYGKEEIILEVTPRGRAMGFTTQSLARQVRDAFEGAIAIRFARGDEEVPVRVQNPRGRADAGDLDDLYLVAPSGEWVPLVEVVAIRHQTGFSRIQREDGARQVAVTAEIDMSVTSTARVIEALERDGLAAILERAEASARYAGRAEEQQRTFADMKTGALLGLIAIYIILAWVFASYLQPLVVMGVIPLAFVGAVSGHLLLGYDLTILSLVALIGLSGVVVNDSIILVTTIKEHLLRHEDFIPAIIDGARERLRAVTLTSLTTVGGLTPMLFETSRQAQFLIPMAVTIVFGLLVTTLLVLLVVPALLGIIEDLALWRKRHNLGGHTVEEEMTAGEERNG